jgi:hypothetical protein
MKYTIEQVIKKLQVLEDEFITLDNFIANQPGWIAQNFTSHKFIETSIQTVKFWLDSIDKFDNNATIYPLGDTKEEQLSSCLAYSLRQVIQGRYENFEDANILSKILIDLGTSGIGKFVDKFGEVDNINLFAECLSNADLDTFESLLKNTSTIEPIDCLYTISKSSKFNNIYQNNYGNVDELLISLIDKVSDKQVLFNLLTHEKLDFTPSFEKALTKYKLEFSLTKNVNKFKRMKI